jgi:hypothetical protein
MIDRNNMPNDLLKYAMSMSIDADANMIAVALSDDANLSFRGNTPRKLINIDWQPQVMQTMRPGTFANSGQSISMEKTDEQLDIHQIERASAVLLAPPDHSVSGEVTVFDIQGRQVLTMKHEGTTDDGQLRIELPGLQSGLYLMRYTGTEGSTHTGKFYYPQCR